jgi:hypothetical protein
MTKQQIASTDQVAVGHYVMTGIKPKTVTKARKQLQNGLRHQ